MAWLQVSEEATLMSPDEDYEMAMWVRCWHDTSALS